MKVCSYRWQLKNGPFHIASHSSGGKTRWASVFWGTWISQFEVSPTWQRLGSPETAPSCVSARLLPPLSHMFVLLMMRKTRRRRRRGRRAYRKRDTWRSVPLWISDTWGGLEGSWRLTVGGGSAGPASSYCMFPENQTTSSLLGFVFVLVLNFKRLCR